MNVQLSDIAKFAYGSGFNEGVKGGRGFLALDSYGQLTKVYTHRSDASQLNRLNEDEFLQLKSGSDRLAASIVNLAKSRGVEGEDLQNICDLLGCDENGEARAADGATPRAKQLLDRKVVASVVSIIDPDVWEAQEDGGLSIAEMAQAVSSRGKTTDGSSVLEDKRQIAGFVESSDMQLTLASLKAFGGGVQEKVKTLVARELSRLSRDGVNADGTRTANRANLVKVVVPKLVSELEKMGAALLNQAPDRTRKAPLPQLADMDLTRVDLTSVLRGISKRADGRQAAAGSDLDQWLTHAVRQALSNGVSDPSNRIEFAQADGRLVIQPSAAARHLERCRQEVTDRIMTIADRLVAGLGVRLDANQEKQFKSLLATYAKEFGRIKVTMAHKDGCLSERNVMLAAGVLLRLVKGGVTLPRKVDELAMMECDSGATDCLLKLSHGHDQVVARLLAYTAGSDLALLNLVVRDPANFEKLEAPDLDRTDIYRMVVGEEPPAGIENMKPLDFYSGLDSGYSDQLKMRYPNDYEQIKTSFSSMCGGTGIMLKGDLFERIMSRPIEGLKVSMDDVLVSGFMYDVDSAMALGLDQARKGLQADVDRNHTTYVVQGQTFSFPVERGTDGKKLPVDTKPLFDTVCAMGRTPEQKAVVGILLSQGGVSPFVVFSMSMGSNDVCCDYTITQDETTGTITLKGIARPEKGAQFDFTYEIQADGTSSLKDLNYTLEPNAPFFRLVP